MTTHLADLTVAEALEAEIRLNMARRAKLVEGYGTRKQREAMLVEVDDLLEEYNLLTLGR